MLALTQAVSDLTQHVRNENLAVTAAASKAAPTPKPRTAARTKVS